MDKNYTVRRVGEADLGTILTLERLIFGDPWSAHDFEAFFAEASLKETEVMQSLFLKAVNESGDIAGYVCARRVMDEGEIMNVAVSPEMRRCGVGRLLMNEAMDAMHQSGAESIFLEVRQSNTAAQSLYESLGFEAIDVRKNYYANPTENAVIMCRTAVN